MSRPYTLPPGLSLFLPQSRIFLLPIQLNSLLSLLSNAALGPLLHTENS